MNLATKPDFAETIERFDRWWRFEPADRALVRFNVAPTREVRLPQKSHATVRELWLDIEFNIERIAASIESRTWLAESVPVLDPNFGPVLLAVLFGCELTFTETTSWAEPIVKVPDDWDAIISRGLNFAAPLWQLMEKYTDCALRRAEGRFVVGITDLHGAFDTLAGIRGSESLCMDLLDCPEKVARAAALASEGLVEAFQRLSRKICAAGMGSSCWIPFYHSGPAYVPSCDFWCLISRKMAAEFVDPTILAEVAPLERAIFHLDGPQALKHLPWLLSVPQIHAIQWVYGAGNGPAMRWLDVYRRCLRAGKSIEVLAESPRDALDVLRELGSHGVWLSVAHEFATVSEATEFVDEVARLSR